MRDNRRAIAICAALLWLLGIEVLPNVHLGTHDRHHTHAVDGSIVSHDDNDDELERLHELAHRQAGTKCLHTPRGARGDDRLAYHAPANGHAAAGIAHHATALLDPPPPITTPAWSPHAETWRFAEPNARLSIAHAARPSARGPPVA